MRTYTETYWKFDPVASLPDYELEQIVSVPDLMPYEEFLAGRFYREWAQPQGWIDAANAVLEKSTSSCAYLTVLRNQACGMVDDEMRRRMGLLVPHVRRAVRTGKVIDLRQAEAATFADILDGLNPAIFLVDAEGQIVHGNAASRSLMDTGDLLRVLHGRLTASDAQVDQTLQNAIIAAATAEEETGGKGGAVSLRVMAENGISHVLPWTRACSSSRCGFTCCYGAVCAQGRMETAPPSEVIGKQAHATELRVRSHRQC